MPEELSDNPLAPITPPLVETLADHTADAGAASAASVEALLTLHREELRSEMRELRESVAALPEATAAAIAASIRASEQVAAAAPAEALGTPLEGGQTTLELERTPTVTVTKRRAGLALRR